MGNIRRFRRAVYGFAALVLAIVVTVPVLRPGNAYAAQVQSRSIEMSSSAVGTTGTSYNVGFNVATTGTVAGIVIEFCDNTPIIGDTTCTLPTGFTLTASP